MLMHSSKPLQIRQPLLLALLMATPLDHQAYKHIIPLDFNSVKSVPESFVWSHSDDIVHPDNGTSTVPVIDLMDPHASKLIIEACETWGVFQLINHGVPTNIMDDIEAEARRLFDLPVDQKLKIARSLDDLSGYGIAPMQSMFSTLMWHEGLTVFGSAIDHAKALWPDDYRRFSDTLDEYQIHVKALTEKLIRILFKALNIPIEDFNWFNDPTNSSNCNLATQLNSYPPCPEPTLTLGLAPHTDTSILTTLQARTNGLQVFKDGAGWVPVEPADPYAIVVNLGDIAQILSNGRFVSVLHRVMAKPVQRYSVAYFFRPPMDFVVSSCLSRDLDLDEGEDVVVRYRSVTAKEYYVLKAKYHEKTLSMVEN